jgi:hypothetical protein
LKRQSPDCASAVDVAVAVAVAVAAGLAGCSAGAPAPKDRRVPLWFELSLEDPPGGLDAADPLPWSTAPIELELGVQAMGHDREPLDWSGRLDLHVRPGTLSSATSVDVLDGSGSAAVEIAWGYDRVRLWASDEAGGTLGDGSELPASYATGAAPAIHVRRPTLRQVQEPVSAGGGESPLLGSYVPIRGWGDPLDSSLPDSERRDLVVTAVVTDGFYVSDRSDPPGSFNSIFAFNHSRPDGLEPGSRLSELSGIVDEFLGFTELSFPGWTVAGQGEPGEPSLLDPEIVCDDSAMEGFEASLVRVEDLVSDFRSAGDCANYLEFGQWPALLTELPFRRAGEAVAASCGGGDARITVVNANTVPSFAFPECELNDRPDARELDWLVGVLRHTEPANPPWVLEVRDCLDFPAEARPADCPQLLGSPRSGPRKAPWHQYRDIPTCEGVPWRAP